MVLLLAASLVWAFSFGLIGNVLQGVDPFFLAAARLALALAAFAPLLRVRDLPAAAAARLAGIGAVQYGLMYVALFLAYRHLASHEVALFTIFTPLYVTWTNDLLARRVHKLFLLTAALAVAGAAIARASRTSSASWMAGFAWVQASNLCFAFGQVAYRRELARRPAARDRDVFAWLYAGGALTAGLAALAFADRAAGAPAPRQWAAILYLGLVASGLSFFLWNAGARRTDIGAVAAFNNLKIPLAVAVSVGVFGESADLPRLLAGGAVVAGALALNEAAVRRRRVPPSAGGPPAGSRRGDDRGSHDRSPGPPPA
jgi:drug/metabolite transporter (DMT)-like permease